MKLKLKLLLSFALSGSLAALPATAAIQCYDTITDVIVHSNGRIFFTTPKACSSGWCELDGDTTFKTNGYAMLMVAKLKNKTVYFQWGSLASCDAANSAYAVPEFMILK